MLCFKGLEGLTFKIEQFLNLHLVGICIWNWKDSFNINSRDPCIDIR
jgi:hypothetical protein